MRPRALAAVALVLALAPPRDEARAGGAPRIVILAPSSDDRVSLRLRAELRALHFEVPDLSLAPEPPSRERLEEVARRSDAVAAVRIAPSNAGVEVWIVDRMTGKTVLREMVTDDVQSSAGVATVALRVVELLRASLMELDAPRPPQGEVPPPSLIRALMTPPRTDPSPPAPPLEAPPRSPPALSVELGPAALLSPGGLRTAGDLNVAVHFWRPHDGLGASLVGLVPIVPATVRGPEGVTAARIALLGAAFRWVFSFPASAWTPSLGAGLAGIWLHLDSAPSPGYVGTSANLFTFAGFGRAGIGFAVAPRLRLRADALAGMVNLRPVVKFGERVAAVWGVPFVAPTLGLELSWP